MKKFTVPSQGADIVECEAADPSPTGREVVLRVTHSGVCHSDTHVHAGGYDAGEQGWISMADRGLEFPTVLGHEIVGEIVSIGDAVDEVEIGSTRLVYPWLGCGTCARCSADMENLCRDNQAIGIFRDGGFATHVRVPDPKYLVDVDGLDPSWAATLACSGLTSYSAVRQLPPLGQDERVAVIGAGGVGLMAIALLRQLTLATVVAVDVSNDRLEIARDLGAQQTVNSAELGSEDTLMSRLGGPVQGALDFVNTGDTFSLVFGSLDKGATLVSIGLFGGETLLPTALLPLKSVSIRGSYVGNLKQLRELVDLAKRVELPHLPISPGPLSESGVRDGLRSLVEGSVRGRIVLSPSL